VIPSLSAKQIRVIAFVLLPCIVGTGANYYLDLGWFGHYGGLAMMITVLLVCILLTVAGRW
jgi:hypothetical protein